jgi:hypothetical protein
VLIIQIRDRRTGGWENPYVSENIGDHATKPFFLLQHNWFKMMEYSQNELLNQYSTYSGINLYKVTFQYAADSEENKAALNFHLTKREEKDIVSSIRSAGNLKSFQLVGDLLQRTNVQAPSPVRRLPPGW